MTSIIRHIVLLAICTSLCACSLVLEDPRPYPAPMPDSAVAIADAGVATKQQSLRIEVQLGAQSNQRSSVDAPNSDHVPDVAWWSNWLCWELESDEEDMCWFLEFVIEL